MTTSLILTGWFFLRGEKSVNILQIITLIVCGYQKWLYIYTIKQQVIET